MQVGVGVAAILGERADDREHRSTRVGNWRRRDQHGNGRTVSALNDERSIANRLTRATHPPHPSVVQIVGRGSPTPEICRALIDTKDTAVGVADADRHRQHINRLAVERVDRESCQIHSQPCSDTLCTRRDSAKEATCDIRAGQGCLKERRRLASLAQGIRRDWPAMSEPGGSTKAERQVSEWRRGWDSNPRAGYPTRRFRGAPVTTTSVPLRSVEQQDYTVPAMARASR